MKKINLTIFLAMSLFLLNCAGPGSIVTDYDRDADFSRYRTFFWSDEFQVLNEDNESNEPLFYNSLIKKRLKNAIRQEMEGRGYSLSAENPDLLVNAQVVVEERGSNQAAQPFFRGFYYPGAYAAAPARMDKEGDIVVELIDKDQRQLVWQGYAPGVLSTQTRKREEEIKDAVTLIFAEYGSRAGQELQRR